MFGPRCSAAAAEMLDVCHGWADCPEVRTCAPQLGFAHVRARHNWFSQRAAQTGCISLRTAALGGVQRNSAFSHASPPAEAGCRFPFPPGAAVSTFKNRVACFFFAPCAQGQSAKHTSELLAHAGPSSAP